MNQIKIHGIWFDAKTTHFYGDGSVWFKTTDGFIGWTTLKNVRYIP